MRLSINQLRQIIKEEAEVALGGGGKLERLKTLVAEIEAAMTAAGAAPVEPEIGGVFVDLAGLLWTRVAAVKGTLVSAEAGPGPGRGASLRVEDFMDMYVEAPRKEYLYFPPGPGAKAAVSGINKLSRLCQGI